MTCNICAERNVGPEHELSEKHIKNKLLWNYTKQRKKLGGNRKGALVSCNVKSSFTDLADWAKAKIKVSVRPNEEIVFNFKMKNDSKKEDLVLFFVQMAHNAHYFEINDHGLGLGCEPLTLRPKESLKKNVTVKFKCRDIGQYEMPIIFSLRKPAADDSFVIFREMVVYVEEKKQQHEKIISPYTEQEVTGDTLFKSTSTEKSDDMFRIPKNYKKIYASNLRMKEDANPEEAKFYQDICDVFKAGVTEDNYVRFFHNLLWYEETIVRINLKKYNMSGVPLQYKGNVYGLFVPGLAEKRPSLIPGDLLFVKPHNTEEAIFEAIITEICENTIHIGELDPHKYHGENALFDIRFFMSRMPLERMHRAVDVVAKNAGERIFPQENKKTVTIQAINRWLNPLVEANPEQRLAVERIVGGSAGAAPYLVHGPPGTGKTITIVEAVLQLVIKKPTNRVMVCTDSNMAADHVATELVKYLHLIDEKNLLQRCNSKYRNWETLPEVLHKFSNGSSASNFYPIGIDDFNSYRIVVTTLSHAAKFARDIKSKRMARPITHLFIDEAAQASEPACLIPICGLLAPGGSLVLAGDPLQLGPVVISHNARRLGLGLSLMERLQKNFDIYSDERNDNNYGVMLRNNFRSNSDILYIPNEIFYKGQLRALAQEDPISQTDILGERVASRAIVFHGVLSKEQRMGKSPSFYNNMELEIVQSYVKALIKQHNVQPDDIGIVAPYIRQVYKIKEALSNIPHGPGKIEVGTVEAFQGKEKRVILVSTVRANCGLLDHDAKFQLGFLVDDKRFNVALTRAKAKAIVIGNPLCLERDAKWRTYIAKCREFGTYFGYDPQLHHTDEIQKAIVEKITPIFKNLQLDKAKA